jgi:hypothetical protein
MPLRSSGRWIVHRAAGHWHTTEHQKSANQSEGLVCACIVMQLANLESEAKVHKARRSPVYDLDCLLSLVKMLSGLNAFGISNFTSGNLSSVSCEQSDVTMLRRAKIKRDFDHDFGLDPLRAHYLTSVHHRHLVR